MTGTAPPRVLDRSTGLAGAYAALLLHQAGGDVVRAVPDRGDPAVPEGSPLAAYLRQGQRAVPAAAAGLDGAGADVVLATPQGGEREAVVAARRTDPGLTVVAITPYGLTAPSRDRPATDLTLQADSGALAIRGRAGEEPVQMGGRTVEWLAGAYAAAAALAAWRARRAGGPGALVDLSLAEVANLSAGNFMDVMHALALGPDAEPESPPRVLETPSIERTSDGWVGFNTNAPHQATAFLRMMGRDDLADSGEWMMAAQRLERIDEWQAMVTAWTSVRTVDEVIEAAVAHHVPVAPVCDGRTVAGLDHVRARGSLVPGPDGTSVQPGRPWRIDGDAGPGPEPPPPPPDPGATVTWRDDDDRVLPSSGATAAAARPLAGLRVLDLTAWWAGPSATGLLAALGADVVHVEGPDRMDGVRMVGMAIPGRSEWWEHSSFFLSVNCDKRDLVLDLAADRGREVALALVAEADVVVENFTPRVLDKLGLGWDAVHAANPRTVMVRMPAFGLDGPWRDRPGFAQNIEQASGLAWLTGRADDQPRIQRGPSDPNGGVHAAIGLMVALDRRERTGEGSLVEVALFEAALALAAESITTASAEGVVLTRDGNRSAHAAPQGVYRTQGDDDWLAVSCATDAQWRSLCVAIDRPALADEPALADRDGRRRAHDHLDEVIGAWAAATPAAEAEAVLLRAGVPAALARDPRLAARHPDLRARQYHQVVEHPVAGPVPVPTLPFRLEGVDRWVTRPAPCFGQHTDEVLTGWLGLAPADLAALRAEGVVADRPVGV